VKNHPLISNEDNKEAEKMKQEMEREKSKDSVSKKEN